MEERPSYGTLQRPRCPPPPAPAAAPAAAGLACNSVAGGGGGEHGGSNGRLPPTAEPASQLPGKTEPAPVPPPRKMPPARKPTEAQGEQQQCNDDDERVGAPLRRRCRALYDCCADQQDELSFSEGEVIVVISETTEDDLWMEGMIEGDPQRRGVFPASFVHMLSD